jgi:hypothetical protein
MTIQRGLYTNIVLTVIAGCLLVQCALQVGTRVDAQTAASQPNTQAPMPAQPVVIVGWGEMSASGQIQLHMPQTPIPVAIASPQPVPVAITGIHNAFGQWDPITTRLEPQAPASLPGYPSPKH